jgi:hypothetical protein
MATIFDVEAGAERYNEAMLRVFQKAHAQLEQTAPKRPFKLTAMNDSLAATYQATRVMIASQDAEAIFKLLKKAQERYAANSFSILLEAMVFEVEGKRDQANQYFEKFLLESRTYTPFDEKILKRYDFYLLRRSIYNLLEARGVTFEGRESEIQNQPSFEALVKYLLEPQKEDTTANLLLLALIFGGGVFLAYAAVTGAALDGHFTSTLPLLYVFIWIAYGFWITDLAFGLPFGWTRRGALIFFLGGGLTFNLAAGFWFDWKEKTRPLGNGMTRCPCCKFVIVSLLVECPKCHSLLKRES